MTRDTSWDDPQLSDGDSPSIKKQREELIKKWDATGLLDDLKSTNKTNIAELMESEASILLKKEILKIPEIFIRINIKIVIHRDRYFFTFGHKKSVGTVCISFY